MGEQSRPSHLSLVGVYAGYFAGEGLMATYWPHHMATLGMDPADIGLIFSVRMGLAIVAQPVLAALSDKIGRPRGALKLAVVLSLLAVLAAPWVAGFAGMALVIWAQAPPRSAIVPLLDATNVRVGGAAKYGRLRLWGSIGYGVTVAAFGLLAQHMSYAAAGALAVPTYLVVLGLAAVAALSLPGDEVEAKIGRPQLREMARLGMRPLVLFFFAVHALHWATVMFFNIFLSVHTKALGHDPSVPGLAVFVAIVAEVAALYAFGTRAAGPKMKAWSLCVMPVSALRWAAMAFVTDAWALIAVQLTHFFTFGVWLVGLMAVLGRFAPMEQRGAMQGLFSALVLGVGGVLGSWLGGVLVKAWDTQTAFAVAGGLEIVAWVGLWLFWAAYQRSPRNQSMEKV